MPLLWDWENPRKRKGRSCFYFSCVVTWKNIKSVVAWRGNFRDFKLSILRSESCVLGHSRQNNLWHRKCVKRAIFWTVEVGKVKGASTSSTPTQLLQKTCSQLNYRYLAAGADLKACPHYNRHIVRQNYLYARNWSFLLKIDRKSEGFLQKKKTKTKKKEQIF